MDDRATAIGKKWVGAAVPLSVGELGPDLTLPEQMAYL